MATRRKRTAPRSTGKRRTRRKRPIAFMKPVKGDERVLCLDTSSRCVGWAIFDNGNLGQHGRYLQYGDGHGEKLASFRRWILQMCEEFRPTHLIYEAPYRGLNGKTFGILSKYAGVVESTHFEFFGEEMPLEHAVPAKQVKIAIGSPPVQRAKRTRGKAKRKHDDVHEQNKRIVTQLVNERFGLALKYKENDTTKKTSEDDEADAIALGWAWHLMYRTPEPETFNDE